MTGIPGSLAIERSDTQAGHSCRQSPLGPIPDCSTRCVASDPLYKNLNCTSTGVRYLAASPASNLGRTTFGRFPSFLVSCEGTCTAYISDHRQMQPSDEETPQPDGPSQTTANAATIGSRLWISPVRLAGLQRRESSVENLHPINRASSVVEAEEVPACVQTVANP